MMSDITILETSLHRIDLELEEMGERIAIGADTDFNGYVQTLIDDIYDSSRSKSYKFPSDETEVARQVLSIDNNNWIKRSQIIAKRLLRIEKITQKQMQSITDLRKGSLVQLLVNIDGKINFIITKVDHNAYIDEESLKKQSGLPETKRAQKTAFISYEDKEHISGIKLSDSNSSISKYWWSDFLEVEELNPSEKNTVIAFKSIDAVLKKEVRKKSKSDYWALRNAVISYFRVKKSCTFDDLVESIIDDYQPDSSELNMEQLKQKITKLPKQKKFDSQFEISSNAIKARMVKSEIKLADNLELKLTGEVDIKDLITTGESEKGRRYIQIYSDLGYDEFNNKQGNDNK